MRAQLLLATALSTPVVLAAPVAVLAQGPAPFDWTGFYVGQTMGLVQSGGSVDIGYPAGPPASGSFGFEGNTFVNSTGGLDPGLPTLFALSGRGSVVGIDAGYNKQMGQFVFGLEGDLSKFADGAAASASGTSTSGNTVVRVDGSVSSLLSARARAGVSIDRLMLFATAGFAAGQASVGTDLTYQDNAKGTGSTNGIVIGAIGGVGAEYALTDKISIKAEGLYYRLGSLTATATGDGTSDTISQPYTATYSPSGYIVRGGLNVHF